MAVKTRSKSRTRVKAKPTVRAKTKRPFQAKLARPASESRLVAVPAPVRVVNRIAPPRNTSSGEERRLSKGLRLPQFAYMKAPGLMHIFEVGDAVEVYCDHEKSRERIRGWIRGIVVQVDNKMVAVQFRSNVFLTDGWMVPDRILWYPLNSEHMRPVPGKKSVKKERAIPEY